MKDKPSRLQLRPNNGMMFERKKKTNPRSPDFVGEALINGRLYEVAGWKHTTRHGNIFLSLTFDDGPPRARADAARHGAFDKPDDDPPF